MPRPLDVAKLTSEVRKIELMAKQEELAAIARRLDIPSLDRLEACLRGGWDRRSQLRIEGRLVAEVQLICAVTGELLSRPLEAKFCRMFGEQEERRDIVVDPVENDIEPLEGNILDVGEMVIEELALTLPVFPRSAGADAHLVAFGGQAPDDAERPFSELAKLAETCR